MVVPKTLVQYVSFNPVINIKTSFIIFFLFILLKGISTDIFVVDIFLRNFYLSIFFATELN
jgi:hypothetical protein